jgi:ATP-dependent DNA ligase
MVTRHNISAVTAEEPAVQSRDPLDWRPLEATMKNRNPEITDPIIEPLWDGSRVLAHFKSTPGGPQRGTVKLIDTVGDDVTDEYPEVVEALTKGVYSVDAVIDGVLTYQALAGGQGVSVVPGANISNMGMLMGRPAEVTMERPHDPQAEEAAEVTSADFAFVALDLLSVDGQTLFDLPLLERKRQLDSLIGVSEYARVSPFARPPVAQWLNSWKSAGFRGVVLKAANSRYRPADVASKWAIIERISGR